MSDVWLDLTRSLLRPVRPDLTRCLAERELHLEERKRASEQRRNAITDCERRIEALRASVFAASDGVVGLRMTDLEREWRTLARVDPDAGLMNLWARIAPRAWHDKKRWRDSPAIDRVDIAVALASDVEGVEAAEARVVELRAAYAEDGVTIAPRVAWRFFDLDRAHFVTTFREPPPRIREDVRDAVLARLPERPLLARDVAYMAAQRSSRVGDAIRALWRTGYGIHTLDANGVTLEVPAVSSRGEG